MGKNLAPENNTYSVICWEIDFELFINFYAQQIYYLFYLYNVELSYKIINDFDDYINITVLLYCVKLPIYFRKLNI